MPMFFPINVEDISILLSVMCVVLMIVGQFSLAYHGKINFAINNKRLKNIILALGILFALTVAVHIYWWFAFSQKL